MSTPLLAVFRFNHVFTVDGLTHKFRQYVKATASPSTTNGWSLFYRDSSSHDIGLGIAAFLGFVQGIATPQWSVSVTTLLEELISGAWNPQVAVSTTITPNTASYVPAGQLTITLRDTAFNKLRKVFLESDAAPGQKTVGNAATNSAFHNVSEAWDPALSGTDGPWHWEVGRSNLYLGSASIIGGVTDLNDKVRRARHIS